MTDSKDDDTRPDSTSAPSPDSAASSQPDKAVDQDTLADDWAAALAQQEQTSTDTQARSLGQANDDTSKAEDDTASRADDDWAATLAEQTAAETAGPSTTTPRSAAAELFQPLSGDDTNGQSD